MAISERYREEYELAKRRIAYEPEHGPCPDAPTVKKLIEELSAAENQLAKSRKEFFEYRKSAASTEEIAHRALDDLQRAKLAIEDEQRAFTQYAEESKATIAARDREIAELGGECVNIKERYPEPNTRVMVFTVGLCEPDGWGFAYYPKDRNASMYWDGIVMGKGCGVTHWKNIPNHPPKSS